MIQVNVTALFLQIPFLNLESIWRATNFIRINVQFKIVAPVIFRLHLSTHPIIQPKTFHCNGLQCDDVENGKYAISLGLYANVTAPDAQINFRKNLIFINIPRHSALLLTLAICTCNYLQQNVFEGTFPNGQIILDLFCFAVYLKCNYIELHFFALLKFSCA